MAIDVTIKQRLFGSKTMPLAVILGESLHYGNFVSDRLIVGELGDNEIVAYHPEHIGRGFSVVWNPNEKRRIDLRLPMPSTREELSDFYAAVERMVAYWGGKLVVDGSKVSLPDFLDGFEDMAAFNDKVVRKIAQQIIDGESETLTLYSAMWPLTVGAQDAEDFLADPSRYALWLHEKQTVDAGYAVAAFYEGENGILGKYTFMNGKSCIFQQTPRAPFGVMDPSTGKALECSGWSVVLELAGAEEPLGELDYAEFLYRIPEDKLVAYDGDKVRILAMDENEIRALIAE